MQGVGRRKQNAGLSSDAILATRLLPPCPSFLSKSTNLQIGKDTRAREDDCKRTDTPYTGLFRPFPVMLVKVAFSSPSNARFLTKKCSSYAHFSKLCSFCLKNALFYFEEKLIQNKASRVFYKKWIPKIALELFAQELA